MNQRLSRTEIRRDELVEGLNKGFEFTHDHLRQILIGLAAVGVLGLGWLGFRSWRESGEAKANAALAEAQRVYTAPLAGEADASAAAGDDRASFPDAEARRARAEELFTAVRRDHGRAPAADAAAIYLAKIALDRGDTAAAERLWREVVAKRPDAMIAGTARLDLVRLDRTRGKGDEALRALEEMLRAEDRKLPDDVLLYELAATLQGLGRPAEARGYLQRILDEFPRSSYRGAAQQDLASLPAPPAPGS